MGIVGGPAAHLQMLTHFCCVFTRLSAQADQSGSSLCHHDQQLRVWEGFLPKIQPGKGAQTSAQQQQLRVPLVFISKAYQIKLLHDSADGAKFRALITANQSSY